VTAILHPAPTDLLPWYERAPDGTFTGRDWATEDQARAEAAPGRTVHQETSALVGALSFGTTTYTRRVSSVTRRSWKPRGWGG
jgi:hypothetical protein